MKEFLDLRAAIVSFLFSAFGSALTRLFVFDNSHIGWNVTGFAALLSFAASLLISVFFIKRNKKKIKIRRYLLLGLVLASGFIYFFRTNQLVCPGRIHMLDASGNDSSYTIPIITGNKLILQDSILNQVNNSSLKCSLCDSLGTHDPYKIWTSKSIQNSLSQITFLYIFFVVSLVALITHLIEELLTPPGKKQPPAKNTK